MKDFPLSARAFVYGVVAAGVGIVGPALILYDYPRPQEFTMFLILGALAGSKKIRLIRSKKAEATGTMSVAFAVTFAAILHFGPEGGALVGLISGLSACLYPKRQPLYQAAFNLSDIALAAYLSGRVFIASGGRPGEVDFIENVVPAFAAALTYYLLNTFSVAAAIALSSRGKVLKT